MTDNCWEKLGEAFKEILDNTDKPRDRKVMEELLEWTQEMTDAEEQHV